MHLFASDRSGPLHAGVAVPRPGDALGDLQVFGRADAALFRIPHDSQRAASHAIRERAQVRNAREVNKVCQFVLKGLTLYLPRVSVS